MSEILTIELPDRLVQQLQAFANSENIPLSDLIVETLQMFSDVPESLSNRDASVSISVVQKLKARFILKNSLPLMDVDITTDESAGEALDISQRSVTQGEESCLDADYDTLLALAGTLELGTTDLGENHDTYIAESLARKLLPDE